MSLDKMTTTTAIAMKEKADSGVSEVAAEETHGRFAVTDSGPARLYPTGKKGQTTKDRRHIPQHKFSDRGKALGKIPGGKDKTYRQLKHEGPSSDDI